MHQPPGRGDPPYGVEDHDEKRRGRAKVEARKPGDGELKPIEDAPGSYVKVRVV